MDRNRAVRGENGFGDLVKSTRIMQGLTQVQLRLAYDFVRFVR